MSSSILDSVDDVRKLLTRFRERVASLGVLEALEETKRLDNTITDKTLYLWNEPYYKRMWLEKNYSVDNQEIAKYFPIMSTIDSMLEVNGEMFRLDFQLVPNTNVWHNDVKLFALWDNENSGGEFSGYLYVDPYPRPGKYQGGKLCCPHANSSLSQFFQQAQVLIWLHQRAASNCNLAS